MIVLATGLSASAASLDCSLQVGTVQEPVIKTATTCTSTGVGGIIAFASYGELRTGGQSDIFNLSGTASFTDTMTIFGSSGTGFLALNIFNDCATSGGICTAAGIVPTLPFLGGASYQFTYGVPFTISGNLMNHDTTQFPPAVLGVHVKIQQMAVFSSPPAFFPLPPTSALPVEYITDSGAVYPFFNAVLVPEPDGLSFALSGLLLLGGFRFIKARSCSG